MSIKNCEFLSTTSLFSPQILVNEFGINPKIALNPAFDETLRELFDYKHNKHLNQVSENDKWYKITSAKLSKDNVPYHSASFLKDGSNVRLEYFDRDSSKSFALGERDFVKLWSKSISLGKDDTLVVDSSALHFEDSENDKIRRLSLERKIYDTCGVLDLLKYLSIVKEKIRFRFGAVSKEKYENLLSLILQLEEYLGMSLSYNLKYGIADVGSYEIIRYPEIIENAFFGEIINTGGKKTMQTSTVPLYETKNNNSNLYDMDYNSIKRLIESGEFEKECFFELPKELLYQIIEDGGKSEQTAAEMKRRVKERPDLIK